MKDQCLLGAIIWTLPLMRRVLRLASQCQVQKKINGPWKWMLRRGLMLCICVLLVYTVNTWHWIIKQKLFGWQSVITPASTTNKWTHICTNKSVEQENISKQISLMTLCSSLPPKTPLHHGLLDIVQSVGGDTTVYIITFFLSFV